MIMCVCLVTDLNCGAYIETEDFIMSPHMIFFLLYFT